jgi:hypothetical protein
MAEQRIAKELSMPDPYRSIVLVAALALPASAALAQLDAPAPPGDPASAMFTLTDVYQRLAAGIPGARRSGGFVEPTSGPASSGFDLDDLMSVAPSPDEGTGATAPQCLAGRRYWSLQPASWGARTGTMPDVGAESFTPGTSPQAISLGYHNGLGEVAGDADLVPGNVRAGVEMFGVPGDPDVVDTASGNAVASEIASGRRVWVDGAEVTGTMPDVGAESFTPGAVPQAISLGYHNGLGEVAGDAELVPENVRAGVEIFGVAGDPNVVDTSSGDAGPGEIASGRRAWVDGVEVIGTAVPVAAALRFVDNGDGTVTDSHNGLVWLEDASCAEIPRTDSDGRAGFADAVLGAADLADGLCGLTDGSTRGAWRLPRDYELWSLVDPRLRSPSLTDGDGTGQWTEGDAFAGVVSTNYWTITISESCVPNFDCRNTVSFTDGAVVRSLVVTGNHYVWPVKR